MLSYRKLAMRVLGRPLHTGGIDSPRPASQRAAAFVLTAALLTGAAFPAFADTYFIEDGDIVISAGTEAGTNKVEQGGTLKSANDMGTIITNREEGASSNTVTINAGNDKVEVTLDNVNIKADSGSALTSNGDVTLTLNGDNSLTGGISGNGSYGLSGISSNGSLTITGDENDSLTAQGGSGGSGIFSNGGVTISGGTVNATGGSGADGSGGSGIRTFSSGGVTISGGIVTATGGDSTGSDRSGGDGISSTNTTISGGTVTATGGDNSTGSDGSGGGGIFSTNTTISGGTVTANGGSGNFSGGNGIFSFDSIDLSGSLELTATAGKGTQSNGKALSQNGSELVLDTIKDKLGPGAKVTATDADGKVIDQVSTPRPVEPEESSSSSDGGSAAPSATVSSLPGLTVTDKSGAVISYTSTQSGNTLTVCVGRFTASFRISLAALRQLRAEGIETIAFQTILCSTTLSVEALLALGGEDTSVVLAHNLGTARLTVGGADYSHLLK